MRLAFLLPLLSSVAFAQMPNFPTPIVNLPSSGAVFSVSTYNPPGYNWTAVQVFNGGGVPSAAGVDCIQGTNDFVNKPSVSLNDQFGPPWNATTDQHTTLNQSAIKFAYPNNVSITKVHFKACTLINGTLTGLNTYKPVLRNKTTGVIYTHPTPLVSANSGLFASIGVFESEAYSSAQITVDLTTLLGAPIQSSDLGNWEIGLAARGKTISVVKFYGLAFWATIAVTSPVPQSLSSPTIAYSKVSAGVPWNNGTIGYSVSGIVPSSAVSVRVAMRCANGNYYDIPADERKWGNTGTGFGIGPGFSFPQRSILFYNQGPCVLSPLTQGQTTNFRFQQHLSVANEPSAGLPTYTPSVTLN